MRLVDADELIKQGWRLERHGQSNELVGVMSIADVPTVEAVPVVHGEWVLDKRKDRIYCNHCNNYTPYEWNETSYEISELISNFCPSCGSDMRKKVQE